MTIQRIILFSLLCGHIIPSTGGFVPYISPRLRKSLVLFSGYGITKEYTWKEEAFEIDVTIQVPKHVKAKDIKFEATSRSVDLRIKNKDGSEEIMLDPSRKLRGRVNLDGTYWVIADTEDSSAGYRQVTVTIEKLIRTPRDDFDVIDYDWKGVFADEEIIESKYDEPEVLDVREYAASMGVDIDNINMSMVDKTMFSSGMNLTQKSLEELTNAGYIQEVTKQADGSEYVTNEDGDPQRFSPLGESIGEDELQRVQKKTKIPFIDTNSPWNNAVPVTLDKETNQTVIQQTRNFTRAAFAQDSVKSSNDEPPEKNADVVDPIDALTVQRLKEILKAQGLPTTGNKKELQDRLRKRVNSLLQGNQED